MADCTGCYATNGIWKRYWYEFEGVKPTEDVLFHRFKYIFSPDDRMQTFTLQKPEDMLIMLLNLPNSKILFSK